MSWLNNANTIASLVLALFGISGYIYGVVTYLKKRADPPKLDIGTSPAFTSSAPKSSVSYKPLSWLEWTELFAQGFVDTADFILTLLFHKDYDPEKETVIDKLGYCAMYCGAGVLAGEFILGFAIGFFLFAMGMSNPTGAAIAITTILLFMTFSLLYIYHVGLAVEMKQLEKYRETLTQQQRQN